LSLSLPCFEGDTRHLAQVHAAIAREIIKTGHPVAPPACILSGGETTVTVKGKMALAVEIRNSRLPLQNILPAEKILLSSAPAQTAQTAQPTRQARSLMPVHFQGRRLWDQIPAIFFQTTTHIIFSKSWMICLSQAPPIQT